MSAEPQPRVSRAPGKCGRLLAAAGTATLRFDHDAIRRAFAAMSWALEEFFAAVEDEFGVPVGDVAGDFLQTPGAVIDFVVDNTSPSDGMTPDEYRDHVAGVVGEIMARTLGVTRYSEDSHFLQDLHVR